MVIGLTGKSGSGKSTISNCIRELGYKVIDVDKIHKEVSENCMDKIYDIYKTMGNEYLTHQEKVDLFFKNEDVRVRVNEVTFKETVLKIWQEVYKNNMDSDIIFLDAPLLYDMKLNEMCDKVWYIYCDKEVNINRIMIRNNVNYDKAATRYNAIDFDSVDENEFDLKINTELENLGIIKERIMKYEESNICR